MRLIMLLLVRDEADILRENLDFHFAQGVDRAIAMDNRSRDGSTEILREYEARGLVRRVDQQGVFNQEPWINELAQLALAGEEPDWILPNDSDEFWMPARGTLKESLADVPADVGGLVGARHNFVPTDPDDERVWWQRMILRERESQNARGAPLPPKVLHRAYPDLVIARGNHRRAEPEVGRTANWPGAEVLHFQMRSYEQFERRVVQIGRAHRHNKLRGRIGIARRKQFRMWRAGDLPAHYADHIARASTADVVEDTRLRDYLKRLYDSGGEVGEARPQVEP